MLDTRKARILRIMVEVHTRTGAPVSSRAILEAGNLNVSTATIRADLVALESEGYAVQPHTSAGRIPTARAYRYYVDALMPPMHSPAATARVSEFFASVHTELGRLLKATSALLSEITHYPSIVTGPGLGNEIIRAIHMVQTRTDAVLMVVVTHSGRVSQSILRLPAPVDAVDLQDAEILLRQYQVGQPMAQVLDPDLLAPGQATGGVASILLKASETLQKACAADYELYLGPTSYLTNAWGEISKVRGVLEILEREAALLEVMGHLPEGTEVRIGRELGLDSSTDISLVSTSYGGEREPAGRIGVLGPMRMDYGRTIRVLEEIGGGLDESLSES